MRRQLTSAENAVQLTVIAHGHNTECGIARQDRLHFLNIAKSSIVFPKLGKVVLCACMLPNASEMLYVTDTLCKHLHQLGKYSRQESEQENEVS